MRYKILCIAIFSLFFAAITFAQPVQIEIDAAKDGPIYGNPEGLARVKKLEEQLHAMEIRKEHPRIFITPDTVNIYRERFRDKKRHFYAFDGILDLAESKKDVVNLAFCYLMFEKDNTVSAALCLKEVKKILFETDPANMDKRFVSRNIAKMALAFDWVYNGLTDDERKTMVERLSLWAKIDEMADSIRKGFKATGETFHREEWAFDGYNAWPEIALAHHNPNADFVYKARWRYDWYWGDAARMYAYAADGTPFEGYYYGADGVEWFLALKSATRINLIDGEFGWCKNAADYVLYRLDLDRGREIFHKGVNLGAGGCVSFLEGTVAWKIKKFFGRTFMLADENPYILWILNHYIGFSEWIFATIGYGGMEEFGPLAKFMFSDLYAVGKNPKYAPYEELPFAKLFRGGNEAYMRTGWFGKPACVGFRSGPAYTKTSHGDFDVNTFVIYKDGVLSPDSGVYDSYEGQGIYFKYQKNTTAHNDLVVIDPTAPNEPKKFDNAADPGGVDKVFTRTFGAPSKFGLEDAFLHNKQADWANIVDFKTTPKYDYVIGGAARAYSSRLDEYLRTLVFIRKENSAYVIVFDRVEAKSSKYLKKHLIHLVAEPKMRGNILATKIPGHYVLYNSDMFESENVFGTSKLFCKMLLPYDRKIAKIGGKGYEFYIEQKAENRIHLDKSSIKEMVKRIVKGARPAVQNTLNIGDATIKRVEEQMGGKWQEMGTWRVELMPGKNEKRDYFMHVMYITDINDTFNPDNVNLTEEGNAFTVSIKDDKLSDISVKFAKTGKPEVAVNIPENKTD